MYNSGDYMDFDLNFAIVAFKTALKALPITLVVTIIPFILGIVFGTIFAIVRIFKVKILDQLVQFYVVIGKGIPLILLMIISNLFVTLLFDKLAINFNWSVKAKDINNLYIALIPLTIYAIAIISETIRGAIMSVGKGQFEAAYSVGLTKRQTMTTVILPQMLPVSLPVLCNNLIGLLKGSSLVFALSVTDLLNASLLSASGNYRYLEAYIAAGAIYWGLNLIIEGIAYILEKRLRVHERSQLV